MPDYFYRRDLPHFTPNDAPYFVTFRLAGTLPGDSYRKQPIRSEAASMPFRDYDQQLDRCARGPTWLKDSRLAQIVSNSVHHFDHERYTLWASTVISNHVHLMLSLYTGFELWDVLHSLKSYTANECNKVLNRHGRFWQHESYDHVVRTNEFGRIIFYILRNPVKAGLAQRVKDWPWSYVNLDLHGFDDSEYLQNSAFR